MPSVLYLRLQANSRISKLIPLLGICQMNLLMVCEAEQAMLLCLELSRRGATIPGSRITRVSKGALLMRTLKLRTFRFMV